MHNPWEEMIPFYIAGTLSKAEAVRLESHLSACTDCNRSLEEWRAIAGIVRDEAASQLRDLPPLSPHVLQTAAQQAQSRHYQAALSLTSSARPTMRSRTTFITLVAAVFTLVVFGGLLIFMLRGAQPQRGAQGVLLPSATPTLNPTATAIPSDTLVPTESFTPTVVGSPTEQPQIIIIEPSNTPTPVPPTHTRIPPTRRPPTSLPPPTTTPGATIASAQLVNPDVCTLHDATPNAIVNLFAAPDTGSAVVKTLSTDDTLTALGKSDTGWYRAQYPPESDQTVGWVLSASVYLSGNCDSLPLIPLATATPTATVIPFLPTWTPSPAAPAVMSGAWSQTNTIVSTTCAETVGATTNTSGTLILNGDSLSVTYSDTGTPFTLTRSGTQGFAGSYTTPNSTITVSLTFTTPTSYLGSAVTTQADGCTTQSAWTGAYAGS